MVAPETQRLIAALTAAGGDARFVGGCVRNALANRKVQDIDIATPLTPDRVIDRLMAAGIKYAPTGIEHGTLTAIVDGVPFEITTLRTDDETDGRRAKVSFTDKWEQDAARRDFTMNAIFADIDGNLYDAFGGVDDLRRGAVRFVGDADARVQEDVLRILRFFRFFAHFGQGDADAQALAACEKHAHLIPKLSSERISAELFKLLEAPRAASVWQLGLDKKVLPFVLPEATQTARLEKMIVWEDKIQTGAYPLRRLAVLLDATTRPPEKLAQVLKMSSDGAKRFKSLCAPAIDIVPGADLKLLKQKTYRFGLEHVVNHLLINAARGADCAKLQTVFETLSAFTLPVFQVDGEDVLALGIPRGARVGELLRAVEDWWVDNNFAPGRRDCLDKLKELA